ncbi:MMPL family transporter [Vibrio rarus]|uniref:MMPL family transporter n=1 Tax=Vibrio rarus TaxID=413403 RepID=UPI0021C4A1C1|nr:MMPL family transporter [Vibrio rarus]
MFDNLPTLENPYSETLIVQRFTDTIIRFPKSLMLLVLSVTLVAGYYGVTHFSMNADLNDLVEQKGSWRDNLDAVESVFPDRGNVVIAVSSNDGAQAKKATAKLAQAFKKQKIFQEVFAPSTLPWFEQYGLGFLNQQDFDALDHKVTLLLPQMMTLSRNHDLHGYLGALDKKLSSEDLSAQDVNTLLTPIAQAANDNNVHWQGILMDEASVPNGYVISLHAVPDFSEAEPNKAIMNAVREVISSVGMPADVMVRVTGQTALDFDEIQDANDSVTLAGTVSLVSLILILAIGIRSLRIIAASYLAVLVGLVWTFAAGLLLVGAFNTISIVFMVIFIGLGVDFAVHLSLHIYDQRLKGHDNNDSLSFSVQHSISPLGLCALSSAVGFLSFYPTAYNGLGELGIISAAGMILGLLATFLVIPLFFQFFGYPKVKRSNAKRSKLALKLSEMIIHHHKKIIALTLLGAVITGYGAQQFQFDFSTLVLKNKNSESVETLQWLQDNKLGSSYQLLAVAKDREQALQWEEQLNQQPEVASTLSANSFLPVSYSQRVAQLNDSMKVHSQAKERMSWVAFFAKYKSLLMVSGAPQTAISEGAIKQHLLAEAASLQQLSSQTTVSEPSVDMLPTQIRQKYISEQGQWLLSITPSGDMRDVSQVSAFIDAVQHIAPLATGRAVAEQQVGQIIIKAFYTAIVISIIGITAILLFSVRYKLDILFIFIPLILTTTTTLAIAHWFGQSLNMANIIVIPLIFGLGVDNGIHIVKRFRREQTITRFFSSSTPKATLISCLTTIATFGSLMLADHQGMHSIGFLLTIALSAILCFSLLILPAFLHRFEPNREFEL